MEGCGAVLLDKKEQRSYNLRYRVCETHLRADEVPVGGKPQRFCQARDARTLAFVHSLTSA